MREKRKKRPPGRTRRKKRREHWSKSEGKKSRSGKGNEFRFDAIPLCSSAEEIKGKKDRFHCGSCGKERGGGRDGDFVHLHMFEMERTSLPTSEGKKGTCSRVISTL